MDTEWSAHRPVLRLIAGTALGLALTGMPAAALDWRPATDSQIQPVSDWRTEDPLAEDSPAEDPLLDGETWFVHKLDDEAEAAPENTAEPPPAPAPTGDTLLPQPDPTIAPLTGPCGTCNTCGCQPEWYGGVEVVWLDRSRPEPFSVTVLDISPPPETVVLRTDDIGFRYEPGLRVHVGHWRDQCTSIEAEYLGLHDWSGSAVSPFSAAGDLDPFWGNDLEDIDTRNFQDAFLHTISYDSELHSFEVSNRHWNGRDSSRFIGIRYVNVDERFQLLSFDSDPSGIIDPNDFGTYTIDTDNHLIGVHVGGMRQSSGERFKFGVRGKAGLFLNFVGQDSHLFDANLPVVRTDLRTDEDDVTLATVLELGAYGMYRVSDRCWVRAGYDLLFISGLALASEQLDIPQWSNSRNLLSDNGSVLYHGPSAGVVVNW